MEERELLSTVTVHILDFTFNPKTVNVHPGDTIDWVFDSGTHSTTSLTGQTESWDSGVHTPGFSFDHTFTNTGTFNYYCTIHGSDNGNGTASGMAGSIIVLPNALLQSIAVIPSNATFALGTSQQVRAIGTLSDQSTEDLTTQVAWSTSSPTVASISSTGVAKALGIGTSTLTASLSGMSGSSTVSVSAATLLSIVISPIGPSATQGASKQFMAMGQFSDHTTQDLTSQVSWSSSNPAVTSISGSGLANALSVGASSIVASFGGISATTAFTVIPAIPPNPKFIATGLKLKAKLHKSFHSTVANFKDPKTKPSNFHVMIDWGDQSAETMGKVLGAGSGRFRASGSHTYASLGTYHVMVMIEDNQGRMISADSMIKVAK